MADDPVVVVAPSSGELQRWYTPEQARKRAAAHVGEQYAADAVWTRIRGHQIQVVALATTTRRDYGPAIPERAPTYIPPSAWYLHQDKPDKFWTGDVEFAYDEETGEIDSITERPLTVRVYVEAFGLRLNPQDVDKHFEESATANEQATSAGKHPGGPKPKPWWDDFWVAMGAHVYAGDIQPNTRQADVSKLMLEWADKHGHDMGDTTAKNMARKLLAALAKEVKN